MRTRTQTIENAGAEYKCLFSKPDNLEVPEKVQSQLKIGITGTAN
jgi:hypothetical protein